MKLTISLLTYNGEKYIPYLLPSLQHQTFKDWELIIMDNNSGDETLKAIRNETINCKLLEQKKNLGFSLGHNKIISWSDSDYVAVINQDLILEPDCLEKLIDFMDQHPQVGACQPKLLYWNFELHDKTNIIDSCGLEIKKNFSVTDRLQGQGDEAPAGQPVFGVSAALAIYRRAALENVKLPLKHNHELAEYFDEDFFAYKEDADLSWRLRLAGWENYFVSQAVAYHDRSISSQHRSFLARRGRQVINKLSYRNQLAMIKKNSFKSLTLKYLWRFLPYEIAKFGYLLLLDRSSLSGLKDYLALRPKWLYKRRYIKKITTIKPKEIEVWLK